MEAALEHIKQLAATGDMKARQQLMSQLHKIAYSLETPIDTTLRYGLQNLQPAVVKTGIDLGLFKLLAESNHALTLDEISQKVGAEPRLMRRLLRYLAAIDAVIEVSKDQYSANNVTKNLSEKITDAGLRFYIPTVGPQFQALSNFLKKTSYKSPDDPLHTVFQDAWNTSLDSFSWFGEHPDHLAPFNEFLALRVQPKDSWLSVYPVEQETKNWSSEKPVFVDIGGGIGHQCAQFKEAYPNVPGSVVLQDLPHSIANALQTPGVENIAHNFFEPQPIKGAKLYYMRSVLHDHPPQKIRIILENTKSAMTIDSTLLIDEMILPDVGVNVMAASVDLTLMSALASMERTEAQWREAIQDVGLELVQIRLYGTQTYEGVMAVKLPQN